MSAEDIKSVLACAAHNHEMVALSIRADGVPSSLDVEPYSIIHRHGVPTLYYRDPSSNRVAGVAMDALAHVRRTPRTFTPLYDIEF